MLKKGEILKTTFDEYLVQSQIGQGGNGTVFEVKNSNGDILAIKAITKNNNSREKLKRFKNELNFCQKYKNNNIIEILDNGIYTNKNGEDILFYVMPEYSINLRKLINEKIEPNQAVNYFLQLCNGLKFAHSKSCFHRDLKPENILYDNKNKKLIIADFGIAHFEPQDKITIVETTTASRLANFSYHAPEQLGNSNIATPLYDIFALGLILNEMLTNTLVGGSNYKKIGDIYPDYSFLDSLVDNMIVQNPQLRLKSIDEVILELNARIKQAEELKKITELKRPVINTEIDDDLIKNPIICKDIKIENNQLIIDLSNNPNNSWVQIYRNALNQFTSNPYCYLNFAFSFNKASYNLNPILGYSNTDQMITNMVKEFKEAIRIANQRYNSEVVYQKQLKEAEEIERRQKEIVRIEAESKLSKSLKELL